MSIFCKTSCQFVESSKSSPEVESHPNICDWKPERDKAGNASATIRFLPRVQGEELPWAKVWSHAFQGPGGKWYIENSLTTLGEKDPVGELNSKLWNSSSDKNSPARKQAGAQKRRLNYFSNIIVVDDPKHPENNGQVRIFKYGKKIHDKIMDKANPTFEDEVPQDVFNYWEGSNFKLKMQTVDNYPNYDKSSWADASPVDDDDEEILRIAKSQYPLAEFTDAKNFKSYAELKTKLESVLNTEFVGMSASEISEFEEPVVAAAPKGNSKPAPAPKAKAAKVDLDEDDVMSYLQAIADSTDED